MFVFGNCTDILVHGVYECHSECHMDAQDKSRGPSPSHSSQKEPGPSVVWFRFAASNC